MGLAVSHELHSLPWSSGDDATHVARSAMYLTAVQAEGGFACPITMTFAAVPALRAAPAVAAEWEPRLTARSYDPALRPSGEKHSALCGMAMTEKQGGSDVRANTTSAQPLPGADGEYELTGHKWFCSAPMCDLFLVLAQAPCSSISLDALARLPSLSFRRWMWKALRVPSGRIRGRAKHVMPSGACASTRKRSHIGAEQNHL